MEYGISKFAIQDTNGSWYVDHGLDLTEEISKAMKFDTEADANRVRDNLHRHALTILPMVVVKIAGDPIFNGHGAYRWHMEACEMCGNW